MRRLVRVMLLIESALLGLAALLLFFQILNPGWGSDYVALLQRVSRTTQLRASLLLILALLIIGCVLTFVYALLTDRMRRTRVKSNDIGDIDISVEALENIALNSAKTAQAGVKSARARVTQGKEHQLAFTLVVVLYSDVEIPSSMARIQDRVRKDVERYTGIPVNEVQVKVSRVELIQARIER